MKTNNKTYPMHYKNVNKILFPVYMFKLHEQMIFKLYVLMTWTLTNNVKLIRKEEFLLATLTKRVY